MEGADPNSLRRTSTKLPGLAIPTEAFFHEGHHIHRHLPAIREGKIEIRHGSKADRKIQQEVENESGKS
jgi:hypothetical protein